ncbi:LysR family transcriptional regulator [Thalassomonas haliotis]|uniref:LysR family transcriptional regulator n=2 Tax=Thalassomonas haliotis TaxID=485448 RepID=A0ABY7VL01_9GAMM|nr:LysR family transcriptional regulator [Thalassomonas haliotis]
MHRASLDDYLLFVTLVESGSFTKAAAKLGMPKSKLSRHIAQLEQQLDSQLLVRSTRRQALTEAGQVLYRLCKPYTEELSKVEEELVALVSQPKGKLNLLLPLEFFNQVMSALLAEFAVLYPQISIFCHQYSGPMPQADLKYDLIFALHEDELPASDWIARALLSFPQSIYASCDYDAGHLSAPEDLQNEMAILAAANQSWLFRGQDSTHSVPVHGRIVLASPEMQLGAAMRNLGLAKLPDYVVQLAGEKDALQRISLSKQPVAQQLTVMYQSRSIAAKTRAFLDYFQSKIGCLS